jgi:hypothetical protein
MRISAGCSGEKKKPGGHHENLSFCPNSSLCGKIESSAYFIYASGSISPHASTLSKNPNFSR